MHLFHFHFAGSLDFIRIRLSPGKDWPEGLIHLFNILDGNTNWNIKLDLSTFSLIRQKNSFFCENGQLCVCFFPSTIKGRVKKKKGIQAEPKGALAHRLQRRTACRIQNGRQGDPKWPTGSGKVSTTRILGVPVNFSEKGGLIRAFLLWEK